MSKKTTQPVSLFDAKLLREASIEGLKKLSPHVLIANPVMFVWPPW